MKDDSSCKACITRIVNQNGNGKLEERDTVSPTVDAIPVVKIEVEVGTAEVEYIESENLKDVEDLDLTHQNLLSALDSKDWVTLVQLLLKASQDKRFVCEAAERALLALTNSVCPTLLLPKLQPNLKHKNPRIRAKASTCFCKSVPRLGAEGIKDYGIDSLLLVAASQLSDQLPESRESAKSLLLELRSVYEKPTVLSVSDHESSEVDTWESLCQSKLSPLSAQAVLRVTSVTRDNPVLPS
ncbi:hypothetical protein V2J09_001274 [Rumex salicifolius]